MSKLKLEIDALQVDSFDTAAVQGSARGTVRGAEGGRQDHFDIPTLTNDPSYVQTCLFYTCGGCTTVDPAYCPQTQQDELHG